MEVKHPSSNFSHKGRRSCSSSGSRRRGSPEVQTKVRTERTDKTDEVLCSAFTISRQSVMERGLVNNRDSGSGIGSVSEVGLGCWQIGGADWGDVSDSEAMAIMHAAVDAGVTFFDTADVYGLGRSEELIGRFVKQT